MRPTTGPGTVYGHLWPLGCHKGSQASTPAERGFPNTTTRPMESTVECYHLPFSVTDYMWQYSVCRNSLNGGVSALSPIFGGACAAY